MAAASKSTATKSATTSATNAEADARKFTKEERAAMRERAKEMRAARDAEAAAADLAEKIAALPEDDRVMAERIHAVVTRVAPQLAPRTWYGMPAYAKDGQVLCFFQPASKFKARYATLGFNDGAALDDGTMWATAFALTEVTPAVEQRIAELVEAAAR
jgi:uncharacterized protein YdhG (YjbR/CyaY superfamily)